MMRLSIWHQFSSNHSAGFTVVGTFETTEKAQHAADEIRRLMMAVVDHYSVPEHLRQFREVEGPTVPMSPVERAFASEYGLDEKTWNDAWENAGIDWIFSHKDVDDALHVYEKLVFVSNFSAEIETWLGYEPFSTLLELLGGRIAIAAEGGLELFLNLTCTAPDEAAAEQIVTRGNNAFNEDYWEGDPAERGGFPQLDQGEVERKGTRLTFTRLWLTSGQEAEDLAQILAVLNAEGCISIQYDFVEEFEE